MLKAGIISQVKSPWNSTIVSVTKKEESSRLCIDFRMLDGEMESEKCSVPSVEEIFTTSEVWRKPVNAAQDIPPVTKKPSAAKSIWSQN